MYPTTYCVVHAFTPVTLSGGTVNPSFRGFMIQGRVDDGTDSPAGAFTGGNESRTECSGVSYAYLTSYV